MIEIKIDYNDSFYKKTNPNTYIQAISETIEFVTSQFVEGCKDEAPVRTGQLRDGHYSKVNGLEGYVCNNVEYAKYVIYGTSRQAPNNYPARVAKKMNIGETSRSLFEQSLITQGVL